MFIVANGNLKSYTDMDFVKYDEASTYTCNYLTNQISNTPDQFKYRHLFIEENSEESTCKCSPNIKNYCIMFEDLNFPFVDMDGNVIINASVSFANASFIISVVQINNLKNTSTLCTL